LVGVSGFKEDAMQTSIHEPVRKNDFVPLLAAGWLLLAAPSAAGAVSLSGQFYLAFNAGAVALQDSTIDYGGARPNRSLSFDPDYAVSGAAGWRVLRSYRVEFEIARRESDVVDVDPGFAPSGVVVATTYMVNGYYDLPSFAGVIPHIGLGLGRAQFTHNIVVDGFTLSNSGSHAFAYQAIGGLEFPIVPRRVSATLEYRYLATSSPLFQDMGGFFYHAGYNSHTFFAGLRWGF
jgi:opacity protein-like surface antigen